MTKTDFEVLQQKFNHSGMTLKSFLKQEGIAYSTYNYWSKKTMTESRTLPIAPISIREQEADLQSQMSMDAAGLPGVTLVFPNGVRAHFGSGSERVLMEVLGKSMSYVLP